MESEYDIELNSINPKEVIGTEYEYFHKKSSNPHQHGRIGVDSKILNMQNIQSSEQLSEFVQPKPSRIANEFTKKDYQKNKRSLRNVQNTFVSSKGNMLSDASLQFREMSFCKNLDQFKSSYSMIQDSLHTIEYKHHEDNI